MTLQELYSNIDGDFDQAQKILRMEKLIDKHIRKLPGNPVFASFAEAAKTMDPVSLFESAHAIKGVCSNLGLIRLADAASDIAEEFRPGSARKMTDSQVEAKIQEVNELALKTTKEIRNYE